MIECPQNLSHTDKATDKTHRFTVVFFCFQISAPMNQLIKSGFEVFSTKIEIGKLIEF